MLATLQRHYPADPDRFRRWDSSGGRMGHSLEPRLVTALVTTIGTPSLVAHTLTGLTVDKGDPLDRWCWSPSRSLPASRRWD